MSAKQNKEILRSAIEKYNKGDLEAFYGILAPDHVYHFTAGVEIKGRDAFCKFDNFVHTTFPDQQLIIEDLIAEGDKVVWRQRTQGTFMGKFKEIAPTGNKVDVQAIGIHRFANGKIVETWAVRDMLTMLQQMGIIKPM
jgi:steroid delta-isomerase-like uncharacterized protein